MFEAGELAELHDLLADGRAGMVDLMDDRCRITRPRLLRDADFDEATGQYAEATPVVIYEGPCRLQVKSDINSNVVEVTAGAREWAYLTSTLQVPITLADAQVRDATAQGDPARISIDDVVDYLSAPHEPTLATRRFQIRAFDRKTHAICRRVRVTELVG